MRLRIKNDRSIHGDDGPDGRLEVIDDVGITDDERHRLLKAFSVPAHVVSMVAMGRDLWELVQTHVPQVGRVVYLCPGNGAWLVEQALASIGIAPSPVQPVDISRESTSDIRVEGRPDHIVIIEDVVETGETARKLADKLRDAGCPVTLATTLWHDRAVQTEQVLDAFAGFHQVLVAERIRSDHPLDDVRSLSTLARKATLAKNQRYSKGREAAFLAEMSAVLNAHDWLHRLGVDLGYRIDQHSIAMASGA